MRTSPSYSRVRFPLLSVINGPEDVKHLSAEQLNALAGEPVYPADLTRAGIAGSAFRISNVDREGRIVPPYTGIRLKGKPGARDVIALFQREPISRHRSLETHIFAIRDHTVHGTVEWVSMADNRTSVFVPFEPMAAGEIFGPFHAVTAMPEHTAEKPAEGLYYTMRDGTFGLYPDGWRDSWYWVFSMLEHIARDDADAAVAIRRKMDALQDEIFASGETGNRAAEKCWTAALDLLAGFGR